MDAELTPEERRAVHWKARVAVIEALDRMGGEGQRRAVLERAMEIGGFSPRELAAPAPPRAAAKHARYVDYALAWTPTNLKREGLLENPVRAVWRFAGVAAASEPARPSVAPERLAELRAMPYRQYLRTSEWRAAREGALERAGHHCALDETHRESLEVHHNSYERLGTEEPRDLVVLCRSCHRLHHQTHGRPRRNQTKRVPPRTSVAPPATARARAHPRPVARSSWLRRLLGS